MSWCWSSGAILTLCCPFSTPILVPMGSRTEQYQGSGWQKVDGQGQTEGGEGMGEGIVGQIASDLLNMADMMHMHVMPCGSLYTLGAFIDNVRIDLKGCHNLRRLHPRSTNKPIS